MANDRVMEFIVGLRREADAADFSWLAEPAAAPSPRRRPFLGSLRTRVAAAVAAAVVSIGSLGGISYAANGAAPGDLLYGLDRALEAVGVGNGGAAERIHEAIVLADEGDPGDSLEHAASVVSDDPGASAALHAAAERLAVVNGPGDEEGVSALLTYLADNVGDVDGVVVADLAGAIHGSPDGPAGGTPVGPPDETPIGPPGGVPAGPPDGVPAGPPDGTPVGPPDAPLGPPDGIPGTTIGPSTTLPTP